ncbi:MAG: CHASE2 domain-containing protein, partial [Candidatus Wallbacteria bacterium]|nr:CHASE2 domain-containing protein [Candidatus Wallbacteria bacterium]
MDRLIEDEEKLPVPWGTALGIALLATALVLTADTLIPELHLWFGDLALKARGTQPLDSRIVLVDIETWPRPRGLLASAIRAVAAMRPRVIALDVLLDVAREDPKQDADLAAAIVESGRVVLPAAIETGDNGPTPTALLQQFARGAVGIGFANFEVDMDGVVRRLPLIHKDETGRNGRLPGVYSAFGPAIAEAFHHGDSGLPARRAGVSDSLVIDWCETDVSRLPTASLSRLVGDPGYRRGLETIGFFKDRIAVIGYLGIRFVGDGFLTPLARNAMDRAPGAIVHANILSNLLQGRSLVQAPSAYAAALAFLAALAGALAGRWRWGAGLAVGAAATVVATLVLGLLGAVRWGVLLNMLPVAASGLAALAMTSLLSFQSLLRHPLVRRVVALFGVQSRPDIAILNISSETVASTDAVKYAFQIRKGDEAGSEVTMCRSATMPDSFENLAERLASLFDGTSGLTPDQELAELGRDIRLEFLGRDAERELEQLGAKHLHIELSGDDLAVPWELAEIGGRPMVDRFGVSRSVVREGKAEPTAAPGARDRAVLTALVVANPRPLESKWEPLPGAEEEARLVAQALEPLATTSPAVLRVEVLTGEAATLQAVTRRLASGEVDIFHFSGHAVFGGGAAGQIGFLFPEGMLGPDALGQTLAGAAVPPVVFANACYTGRALGRGAASGPASPTTSDRGLGARLSLPSAFIGAGAHMYLGCLWQVETEAAARFAVAFYRQLLRG